MTDYILNHNLIIHPEDMINIDDEDNNQDQITGIVNPNNISIYVTPEQFNILISKGNINLIKAPNHKRI
jgi:hypothetical protein